MESLEIIPISHALNARVRVPGSKSLTNRALLIASLAEGTTTLTNALFSDDSHYFANALKTLGFDIALNPDDLKMDFYHSSAFTDCRCLHLRSKCYCCRSKKDSTS